MEIDEKIDWIYANGVWENDYSISDFDPEIDEDNDGIISIWFIGNTTYEIWQYNNGKKEIYEYLEDEDYE